VSTLINDSERRMVPRWRPSGQAGTLGETAPLRTTVAADVRNHDPLSELRRDWSIHRTVPHANDLISAAIALGRGAEVEEAAQYVLRNGEETTALARRLAANVLGHGDVLDARSRGLPERQAALDTARLRASLRHWPDNPIGWIDLARNLTILGSFGKAQRAMQIALGLAPDHRYSLRAATRFFQIHGEPERALRLLRSRPVTREDPWLLSAEIAVSRILGRSPNFVRTASDLLRQDALDPFHTSELAASLASLDFEAGNDRRAKRKFELALRSPTENTVAQALWAERHRLELNLDRELVLQPSAHEANAWRALLEQQWESALNTATKWLADEPFSSRAARFGGYLSAVVFGRYEDAIGFTTVALRAKPDNFGLLNNLAFSYASSGRPELAATHLERVQEQGLTTRERIVLSATWGLIEYRRGDPAAGRRLYDLAVQGARRLSDPSLLLHALIFFAREEARAGSALVSELVQEALAVQERAREATLQPTIDALIAAGTSPGAVR